MLLLHGLILPSGLHMASGRGNVCLYPLLGLSKLLYALDKSRVAWFNLVDIFLVEALGIVNDFSFCLRRFCFNSVGGTNVYCRI